MTRYDFYRLAASSLLPADMPDYWAQYRAGEITHFEALQAIFASIRADEERSPGGRPDGDRSRASPEALALLAGFGLGSRGDVGRVRLVHPDSHAEAGRESSRSGPIPGRFEAGKGLLMELPRGSPFFSPALGVDKTAVVRQAIDEGRRVAFAGDGPPDIDPARLVAAELRFARGDLAEALAGEGWHSSLRAADIAPSWVRTSVASPRTGSRLLRREKGHRHDDHAYHHSIAGASQAGAIDRLGIYLRRSEHVPRCCWRPARGWCRLSRSGFTRVSTSTTSIAWRPSRLARPALRLPWHCSRPAKKVKAVVSLGGGKALDVAKYVAFLARLPYYAVPTSLSNDGFSSPQSQLDHRRATAFAGGGLTFAVVLDLDVCQAHRGRSGSPASATWSRS